MIFSSYCPVCDYTRDLCKCRCLKCKQNECICEEMETLQKSKLQNMRNQFEMMRKMGWGPVIIQEMEEYKFRAFFGKNYYPHGGYEDFAGYFESVELARESIEKMCSEENYMWGHVVLNDIIIVKGIKDFYPEVDKWEWTTMDNQEKNDN